MRIKGVIFVLVIAVLFFGASFISLDSYVESQVEYQASLVNGALVEIDGLEVSLSELKIRWDRLQVTNPENTWENSFETGEAELDFLFWPTLWERVIIEDVVLKDFKFETERETDGYFEMPVSEESGEPEEPGFIAETFGEISSEAKENAQAEFFDIKDDINTDSLLAAVDLKAPDKIDSLRNGLSQNYEKWDSTFSNINIDSETAQIQETLNGIDTKNLKNPEEALAAIKKVELLTKQVDSLKTMAQNIRTDFQQDFGSARFSTSQIDEWIKDDFDRAAKMAKLPTIDAQNIAQSLFGEELFSEYAGYLKYVSIAREYGSRFIGGGDEEEEIERYEGVDYKFSDKYEWPRLWIQNIDLSGETKSALQLAGKITDISTDQSKSGNPMLFDLSGSDANSRSMKLGGEFNYLEDLPKEEIAFQYSGFDLSGTALSPSELLPYPLQQGVGEVNASLSIIDKRIDSEIQYLNKNLVFDFGAERPENRVKQLIQDAVANTSEIDITALVDNIEGPLDVKIRSNIDNLFVDALKGSISNQVEDARNKIESEVESRIGNKKEELLTFKDEKEAELRSQYDQLENKLNEQLQIVEKKKQELEKRKKEIEDEIKKRATDAVRSRIGF
ncbi:MAG: TIGR03545 family protein [Balneola sp.]|nr:MAG: TIGR03545 family protein [Balneola sp.]